MTHYDKINNALDLLVDKRDVGLLEAVDIISDVVYTNHLLVYMKARADIVLDECQDKSKFLDLYSKLLKFFKS